MSKVKAETTVRTGLPLKSRQTDVAVTVFHNSEMISIRLESPKDCWHEGPWLCYRTRRSVGANYEVTKVPQHRVYAVTWKEAPDDR